MVSEAIDTRAWAKRQPVQRHFDWETTGEFTAELVEPEPQHATIIPFPAVRIDEQEAMVLLTAEALEDEW